MVGVGWEVGEGGGGSFLARDGHGGRHRGTPWRNSGGDGTPRPNLWHPLCPPKTRKESPPAKKALLTHSATREEEEEEGERKAGNLHLHRSHAGSTPEPQWHREWARLLAKDLCPAVGRKKWRTPFDEPRLLSCQSCPQKTLLGLLGRRRDIIGCHFPQVGAEAKAKSNPVPSPRWAQAAPDPRHQWGKWGPSATTPPPRPTQKSLAALLLLSLPPLHTPATGEGLFSTQKTNTGNLSGWHPGWWEG